MDPRNDFQPTSQDLDAPNPPPSASAASAAPAAAPASASASAMAPDIELAFEKFAAVYLKDRRTDRRWKAFFRLAWLAVFALIAWSLLSSRNHVTGAPSSPHTALIEVRGEITADGEASAEHLVGALKTAFEEPSATAVVLRMNSPGGSPVQSGIIHDEILRLKAPIKCSALASPSAVISPRTSISAVCGLLGAPVTWLRDDSSDHAMRAKTPNHASLKKAFQRRSVRRSFK